MTKHGKDTRAWLFLPDIRYASMGNLCLRVPPIGLDKIFSETKCSLKLFLPMSPFFLLSFQRGIIFASENTSLLLCPLLLNPSQAFFTQISCLSDFPWNLPLRALKLTDTHKYEI